MDFFARQERSRRTTRTLVVLFGAAFVSVAIASTIAVAFVLNFLPQLDRPLLSTTLNGSDTSNLTMLLGVAGMTMLLMVTASIYRAATLARGGGQVARMLGATEVTSEDADPLHRRLINVVEEMSIASGLPVPQIFVMKHEAAINAFAAGLTPADAAVAVTQGALERLSRAELQGVVAHEFSHVLNGDMRLNQRLIGYSFGILVLSLVGRWLLRSARFTRMSRQRRGSIAVVLGLALTIIGAIGVLFSRLIKAAVSRQREMLADASAVQFTREPDALAGALKKIGGFTANLESVDSEEVAHMLFGQGARSFRGLFATHPPLEERIRALDPSFDPSQFASATEGAAQNELESSSVSRLAPTSHSMADVLDSAGTVETAQLGASIRAAIPEELAAAARSQDSSVLLLAAMIVSPEPRTAARQFEFLGGRLGADRQRRCRRLHEAFHDTPASLRLPLLELSIPALKQRPAAQVQFLFDLLDELLAMDPQRGLFQFVLPRIMQNYLTGAAHRSLRRTGLTAGQAIDQLIAGVARVSHSDDGAAQRAYEDGRAVLRAKPKTDVDLRARTSDLDAVAIALDALRGSPPTIKRDALAAVLASIGSDGWVSSEEIELFRAIAATLDCPVPPIAVGPIAQTR